MNICPLLDIIIICLIHMLKVPLSSRIIHVHVHAVGIIMHIILLWEEKR